MMNDDGNFRPPAPPSMARLLIQMAGIAIAIIGAAAIAVAAAYFIGSMWMLKHGTLVH